MKALDTYRKFETIRRATARNRQLCVILCSLISIPLFASAHSVGSSILFGLAVGISLSLIQAVFAIGFVFWSMASEEAERPDSQKLADRAKINLEVKNEFERESLAKFQKSLKELEDLEENNV